MRTKVDGVQVAQPAQVYRKSQFQNPVLSLGSDQRRSPGGLVFPLTHLTVALLAAIAWAAPSLAQSSATPAQPGAASPTLSQGTAVPQPSSTGVPATEVSPTAIPTQTLPQTPTQAPIRTVVPAPESPVAPFEDTYILGPGDRIQMDIFNVPEFSGAFGQYTLLVDGSINLPWVGRVLLRGQTLEQAADTLTRAYAPYIREPLITVNLLTARSLKVSVVGEVKRPGSYIIGTEGVTNQGLVGAAVAGGGGGGAGGAGGATAAQWPTISQALQSAGGVTQQADLRRVQIRRPMPDGSEQLIDINLWELLRTGQLSQDISLRDRDTLVVPTAADLSSEEALLLGSASFAPALIRVNVVGEVGAPGVIELPPNTPLNQAIMAAGGFDQARSQRSSVDLVRLNPNGTAVKRRVKVDLASGVNDETNPALRDYDTIIVRRNGLTSVSETLESVFAPVGAILTPFAGFFGILNTIDDIGGGGD